MQNTEIDSLLEDQLIGNVFDYELSSNTQGLQETHPFHWGKIMNNPKNDHGFFESRGSWYKTMKYEVLHSNGFLRLFTVRGRLYWNAQNELEHTTPDWKIHFSCELKDIGKAWNILVALFIDMKCEIGMKVTILGEDEWSECQRGREITIYIYRYHRSYKDYMQGTVPELDHDIYLGPELHEVYPTSFWFNFIQKAESSLHKNGVLSRGVADGDLSLPGCVYASLRNEAFVLGLNTPIIPDDHPFVSPPKKEVNERDLDDDDDEVKANEDDQGATSIIPPPRHPRQVPVLMYPPNSAGWNAAKHPNPFLELIFFLREVQRVKENASTATPSEPPPPNLSTNHSTSQMLLSRFNLLNPLGQFF